MTDDNLLRYLRIFYNLCGHSKTYRQFHPLHITTYGGYTYIWTPVPIKYFNTPHVNNSHLLYSQLRAINLRSATASNPVHLKHNCPKYQSYKLRIHAVQNPITEHRQNPADSLRNYPFCKQGRPRRPDIASECCVRAHDFSFRRSNSKCVRWTE